MIVYPYSDIFARYLLGDEKNKDLLISFINAVNEDYNLPLLKEVVIKNPFNLKNLAQEKESIIDVKALDEKGRQYDIEVQITGNELFKHRSLYYWAKLYTSQLDEGDQYSILKPTICINLINFNLIDYYEKVHSCFMLKEMNQPELTLTDHIIIHFLELEKFKKKNEFKNIFEKWIAWFKYEGKEETIMDVIIKDEPVLEKAHQSYIKFTENDELLEIYEGRMKWQADYKTGMILAEEKGIKKGKLEDAKKMLEHGLVVELIAECTGLPVQEIEEMKKNLKSIS